MSGDRALRLLEATGLGRLAARTHRESSLEDLRIISDWYTWLFLQDDMRDEAEVGRHPGELSEVDARFLDLLKGAEPTDLDTPLARALHDLYRRLRSCLHENDLSDVWMRRLVRAVGEHLEITSAKSSPDWRTFPTSSSNFGLPENIERKPPRAWRMASVPRAGSSPG